MSNSAKVRSESYEHATEEVCKEGPIRVHGPFKMTLGWTSRYSLNMCPDPAFTAMHPFHMILSSIRWPPSKSSAHFLDTSDK